MKKYWITTTSGKTLHREIFEIMCNECDIPRITEKFALVGTAAYYDNYELVPLYERVH